ncbi:hypothetical protein BHE74_00057690 [Ensete ventricosum]|nr:hypothetical protein BHE74_00057690 [Ensete ventricosum]
MITQRQDFRGVINALLSWRESIGRKRGRGGGECKDKLQVPRQDGRAETKEHHKTGVDGLLIKIVESEGLGLMQECLTKERSRQYAIHLQAVGVAYVERDSEQNKREVMYFLRAEEMQSGAPTEKRSHKERLTMVETCLDVLEAS